MGWKYWKAWERYLPDREAREKVAPNFEYWTPFKQFLPEESINKPACSFYWRAWEKYQKDKVENVTAIPAPSNLRGKIEKVHA